MSVKSLHSCPTLCDPMGCNPPDSSVHEILLQAKIQKSWSRVPCSPAGDLPDPGTKPPALMSPILEGGFLTTSATWETLQNHRAVYKSRLLLRTVLTAEVDTHPGMPALHTAPRPHVCGRSKPATRVPALIGRPGEHCGSLQGSPGERGDLMREDLNLVPFCQHQIVYC